MNWRMLVLLLLAVGSGYQLLLKMVQLFSADNPMPENVADLYDAKTYEQWKRYAAEKSKLSMVRTCVSFAVILLLLCTNAYLAVAGWFPEGDFWQLLAVVLLSLAVETVIDVVFNYIDTMVIEEKYGFNRTTVKTFIFDQLRGLILSLVLNLGPACLIWWLHGTMGDYMILLFAGVMTAIMLLVAFLYPVFSRIGNKFVPLEEGELKDRLMALLTKYGYKVRAIEVMDASRRTTKSNAYFTGFGKSKTIVLYDNLVASMTPEEICAVFAHELGHGLHKDTLKNQLMSFALYLVMGVVIWLSVRLTGLHEAFGFQGVNYGFALVLFSIGMDVVGPMLNIPMNAMQRFAEYRADRQAVKDGYGKALISGLKGMCQKDFAHLAPSKLNVIMEYSHPPLSERIHAIESEMARQETK